jgi:hypothetical protein
MRLRDTIKLRLNARERLRSMSPVIDRLGAPVSAILAITPSWPLRRWLETAGRNRTLLNGAYSLMPKGNGSLTTAEIDLIATWVCQGAEGN